MTHSDMMFNICVDAKALNMEGISGLTTIAPMESLVKGVPKCAQQPCWERMVGVVGGRQG